MMGKPLIDSIGRSGVPFLCVFGPYIRGLCDQVGRIASVMTRFSISVQPDAPASSMGLLCEQ